MVVQKDQRVPWCLPCWKYASNKRNTVGKGQSWKLVLEMGAETSSYHQTCSIIIEFHSHRHPVKNEEPIWGYTAKKEKKKVGNTFQKVPRSPLIHVVFLGFVMFLVFVGF